MTTRFVDRVSDDARSAAEAVAADVNSAAKKALPRLEQGVTHAARVLGAILDELRAEAAANVESTDEQVDAARRSLVRRVKSRPVTATLAGLGVGLLLGVLLSGRGASPARQ